MDRIDLHIEVMPVEYSALADAKKEESSAAIRERVNKARAIAHKRYAASGAYCNAQMPDGAVQALCVLREDAKRILARSFEKLGLSARAHNRILKVARTVADLEECEVIEARHIMEAIAYRSLDRKYWQSGR